MVINGSKWASTFKAQDIHLKVGGDRHAGGHARSVSAAIEDHALPSERFNSVCPTVRLRNGSRALRPLRKGLHPALTDLRKKFGHFGAPLAIAQFRTTHLPN